MGIDVVGESMEFRRCSDCPATDLLPGNVPAWETYARCWNQVITIGNSFDGSETIIGLQLDSVYRVMESMDIPREQHTDVIDKVNLIHGIIFPIEKRRHDGPDDSHPWQRRRGR